VGASVFYSDTAAAESSEPTSEVEKLDQVGVSSIVRPFKQSRWEGVRESIDDYRT
jgi:hypothetical protein